MANEVPTRRIRENWLGKLFGPAVMSAGVAWIVHLARPDSGTMFDNDNFGGTVILGGIALLVIVVGAFLTRSSLRTVTLEGACPSCGVVATRNFDKPTDPRSRPAECGACIAYRHGDDDLLREEAIEASDMIRLNYQLTADQYEPAIKASSGRYFKFIMPKMCAVCGDPNATQQLLIRNGDRTEDPMDVLNKGHVFAPVGTAPHKSELTDDQQHSEKLSNLRTPVCEKHAKKSANRCALEYFSGRLEFASYRYYKAFCELNHITHASRKGKQDKSAA